MRKWCLWVNINESDDEESSDENINMWDIETMANTPSKLEDTYKLLITFDYV